MIAFVAFGLLIVLAVIVDLLWTTVAAGAGGGPLTVRLAGSLWSLVLRVGAGRHRFLQVAGVVVTLLIIGFWILALWAGWVLVFSGVPGAVVDATTGAPADGWSRVYFTGFSLFTLGTGDYVPGGDVWQVATVVAAGSGLALVTLAITYSISVTSSVTQRRALAQTITALGDTPDAILARAWDGTQLRGLQDTLSQLIPQVAEISQRQLAFPVLHYFHSRERRTALPPAIAVVDELLTAVSAAVPPDARPAPLVVDGVRRSIDALLDSGSAAMRRWPNPRVSEAPPVPTAGSVALSGLPSPDPEHWDAAFAAVALRRCRLADYLALDGWEWADVWDPNRSTD